ncbi:MAG: SPOR domain-containing protein [Alphaproteobacteria bacterium]|nr:SPOR domain-containing protein [Alphaproteobacteria bacterium]
MKDSLLAYSLEERLNRRKRKPIIFISIGVGIVLALVPLIIFLSKYISFSSIEEKNLPVIEADLSPDGYEPKEVGGIEIPDLDKNIYSKLKEDDGIPKEKAVIKKVEVPKLPKKSTDGFEEEDEDDDKVYYYVQVASTKTKESAENEWKRISKKNSELLKNVKHRINQSSGNNLFRLHLGKFEDKNKAKELCDKLKENKQECFVAK